MVRVQVRRSFCSLFVSLLQSSHCMMRCCVQTTAPPASHRHPRTPTVRLAHPTIVFFCGAQDLKQNKATAKFEVKNSLLINKASNPATHLDRKIVSQICLLPLCLFLAAAPASDDVLLRFPPFLGVSFGFGAVFAAAGLAGFRRSRCVLRSRVCLRLGLGSKHRPAQDKIEVGVS